MKGLIYYHRLHRLQKFENPLLLGVDVKSVNAPHTTRKLSAALEAHNEWNIIGTALLCQSESSRKSDLLDNFLSV
jgi:hypothetical protein